MVPTAIVEYAVKAELAGIAVCDHNSAENIPPVRDAARKRGIFVIGGMEITTREEIHVLGLFPGDIELFDVQNEVYRNLPGNNDEKAFGRQWIVDSGDFVTGENARLLAGASALSLEQVVDLIHRNRGIAVASHVNRPVFSVISQLGFIPEGVHFDALEMTGAGEDTSLPDISRIRSSDAHFPEEIGKRRSVLLMDNLDFEEIRRALASGRVREEQG